MIKVERKDFIQYFASKKEFGEWLIEERFVKDIRDFVNEEYSAWEIVSEEYSWNDIWQHYWDAEVMQGVYDWINDGDAEEIN